MATEKADPNVEAVEPRDTLQEVKGEQQLPPKQKKGGGVELPQHVTKHSQLDQGY